MLPGKGREPSQKRRSFFSRPTLSGLTPIRGDSQSSSSSNDKEVINVLRKRRTDSTLGSYNKEDDASSHEAQSPISPVRMSGKGNARPPSILNYGSWRLSRSTEPSEEPRSAVSTKAPSFSWEAEHFATSGSHVICHGEVQTRSSLLRQNKKEYMVLTETHLVRFKSYQKAAEAFTR
jgi:hypothetical protein